MIVYSKQLQRSINRDEFKSYVINTSPPKDGLISKGSNGSITVNLYRDVDNCATTTISNMGSKEFNDTLENVEKELKSIFNAKEHNISSEDASVLKFIFQRMLNAHGEDGNCDYMVKFREIINKISE